MLFNSYSFLFAFLPIALLGAVFFHRWRRRDLIVWWLVAASFVFYAAWSPRYLPLLMVSIAANYGVGSTIVAGRSERHRRRMLIAGVVGNLAVLALFKYADFAIANLDALAGIGLPLPHFTLPVGISFFTFTQIAFLVDAYRAEISAYDAGRYALFVSYFPHLVAGPILHHRATIPQFEEPRFCRFDAEDVSAGTLLFAIGLAKKTLLADRFAYFSDIIFRAAQNGVHLTIWEAWGGALAYAFQIYFDFSGYSDMALGLSRILGVTIPVNFNSPYKADSIIDFWRRWHISLSFFLRDYLYIPLGGNRHGQARRYANLMITMLLGGLWHGAGWGFIVWGFAHGLFLTINHLWRGITARLHWTGRGWPRLTRAASRILTFASVVTAWAFFRASSLTAGWHIATAMFGANGLTAPESLGHHLGRYSATLAAAGVRFEGLFANGLVEDSVPKWIGLLLVGLSIAWLAPNSLEICSAFETKSFSFSPDQVGRVGIGKFPHLSPRLLSILAGICLALGILSLQHGSPFIYYQF